MRGLTACGLALAAALTGCASTGMGSGARIYATVDQSEWVPAGHIRLDLATGSYELMPQPRRGPAAAVQMQRGTLPAGQLAPIRQAYQAARAQGLDKCRDGRPGEIIVSNAGPITMMLSENARSLSTPEELGCWSDEAEALHKLLEGLF